MTKETEHRRPKSGLRLAHRKTDRREARTEKSANSETYGHIHEQIELSVIHVRVSVIDVARHGIDNGLPARGVVFKSLAGWRYIRADDVRPHSVGS